MKADIHMVPLERLIDPNRGISYGVVQPGQHVDDGVPIIRVTDIRNNRIDPAQPMKVLPDIAAKYQRTILKGGELLLTLVGTVGETAIVPPELAGWNTARAVAVVPVLPEPGARWVQYALKTGPSKAYIDARLNATVQATLNLRDVAQLPIPMPPLKVRERIVETLSAIDDKIELNRKINETLEQMARAIFKSWFIDFDPVHAKRQRKKPFGMDDATAALFPDSFEQSELGEIPKGWQVSTIGALASISSGKRPGVRVDSALPGTEIPILGGGGIMGYTEEPLTSGPVLATGRVGTLGKVFRLIKPTWPSDNTLLVAPSSPDLFLPLFFWMSSIPYASLNRGSTQPLLTQTDLGNQQVVLPTKDLLRGFSEIAVELFKLIDLNAEETTTLSQGRDLLLPRLLSGELTIKEVVQ